MRAGAEQQNYATQQRNDLLNEINAQINNLTKGFNNDKLTAQTNYGLGQTQALNEALQMKLGADMNIWQQNDSQEFETLMQGDRFKQEEKMFGLDSALKMQMQRISEAGANGRAAQSNNLAQQQFAWDKERYGLERNDAKEASANALMSQILAGSDQYDANARWGLFSGVNSHSGQAMGINKQLGIMDWMKTTKLFKELYKMVLYGRTFWFNTK